MVLFAVIFLLMLSATLALVAAAMIPADRRRRWRRGEILAPPWTGRCSAHATVDLHISSPEWEHVAETTLERCGIRPESPRPGVPWWLGYSRMGWFTSAHEYALCAETLDAETSRVWCCSQPRFASIRFDFGASNRAVRRITSALDDALRTSASEP